MMRALRTDEGSLMDARRIAEEYARHGYVVFEDVFASEVLAPLRATAERIVGDFDAEANRSVFSTQHEDRDRDRYFIESGQRVRCFLEEYALDASGTLNRDKASAINKIGHALHDLEPDFSAFCRAPFFADALAAIDYPAPALMQTMYIFKQPEIGGEVRWHQDGSYLIADGPGVVGFWIALEDSDRSNGCLWMQPGGHTSPLREIFEVRGDSDTGTLRALDNTPWPSEDTGVPLEVRAGSVVMFADHTPHYSSRNTSDRSRHALTLHVYSAEANWSPLNWLQRPDLPEFRLDRIAPDRIAQERVADDRVPD